MDTNTATMSWNRRSSAGGDGKCFFTTEFRDEAKGDPSAHRDVARSVDDLGAVKHEILIVVRAHFSKADVNVEFDDRAHDQAHDHATILEIGNSNKSEAPASFNAGMSVLMERFSTTLSTA